MTASFQLSPEDFRLFQRAAGRRFVREHGRYGLPFFLSMFAWFCVAMASTAFFRLREQTPDLAKPYGALGALLLVGFFLALAVPYAAQRRFLRNALDPRGSFLAAQTVDVSDDSLLFASGTIRSEIRWSSVLGRSEDNRNHYLFVDSMHALVIPKNAAAALGTVFESRLREVRVEV